MHGLVRVFVGRIFLNVRFFHVAAHCFFFMSAASKHTMSQQRRYNVRCRDVVTTFLRSCVFAWLPSGSLYEKLATRILAVTG